MIQQLCERYGWTLEYVINLTKPQIAVLAEGASEIAELKKKIYEEERQKAKSGRAGASRYSKPSIGQPYPKKTKMDGSGLLGLLTMRDKNNKSVFVMTDRLKRHLARKQKNA